jgi:hypothetical protein
MMISKSRRILRRLATATLIGGLLMAPNLGRAEDAGRVTVLEENDSLTNNTDKHYTQGLRLSWLGPDVERDSAWNGPFDFLDRAAGLFSGGTVDRSRRWDLQFGQSLFTPKDLQMKPPNPKDRPYAAWAYLGAGLIQETDHRRLDVVDLQIGTVGPPALGRQTQNDWHQLIDVATARGWGYQVHTEPGLDLSYERKWRMALPLGGGFGVDFIPEAGATAGNVLTYGDIGGQVRFGRNLQADYGAPHIRPSLSGTDYFNGDALDGPFGLYVYAGTQGRVVGRNIFLEGNSFRSSAGVTRKTLVADFTGGIALFWSRAVRADVSLTTRTQEFAGQHGNDAFGGVNLSIGF